MGEKKGQTEPVKDDPPAYQLEPDGLPDLSTRLKGLKFDSAKTDVSVVYVYSCNMC